MLDILKKFLGREYQCEDCLSTFRIQESDRFIKVSMPVCPICRSRKVRVK